MNLENITGDLRDYENLKSGTFQHVDELTTARRTNPDLRNMQFYTADGMVYTIKNGKPVWAITREPHNLVLQDTCGSYSSFRNSRISFYESAENILNQKDTVVINLEDLNLDDRYSNGVYGYFNLKKCNSEQIKVAQRIYGPDDENFGLNMEMFAEAGITPGIYVLLPEYVKSQLKTSDKNVIGMISWLNTFTDNSVFYAESSDVHYELTLCGSSVVTN